MSESEGSKLFGAFVEVIKVLVNNELDIREKREMVERDDFLSRCGHRWTDDEEEELVREFHLAIKIIALHHKRGEGGIRERLEQMYNKGKLCMIEGRLV